MNDLLKFNKYHLVQNKSTVIRQIRTEIMQSFAKAVYAENLIKSSKKGDFVQVTCEVVVVDSNKFNDVVNAAYADRKCLEVMLSRIDNLCRELTQYPNPSEELTVLTDHVIDRLTKISENEV